MAISRLSQNTLQNAFSKYNNIWDGRSAVSAMEAISAVTLSAARAKIEFNNIPQTYSHLQLRGILQSANTNVGVGQTDVGLRFNVDSGSNYIRSSIMGTGSAIYARGYTAQTYINLAAAWNNSGSNGSYIFTPFVLDIYDYTLTSKLKTVKAFYGYDANATSDNNGAMYICGTWNSTAAITSISFDASVDGTTLNTNSHISLYGIK